MGYDITTRRKYKRAIDLMDKGNTNKSHNSDIEI